MNQYSSIIELIENRLDELTRYDSCSYSKLLEAQRYSVMSGGKHLRGLILIQTAAIGCVPAPLALDFACALEMVHTYSLIHDDLPEMDNDELRRGVATCHVKFGADIALLAGDALLTKAFELIAGNECFPDGVKLECIKFLACACGEHGMLAGQAIDKCSENKEISLDELIHLQNRKTGDMFLAAVNIGCALGNISGNLKNDLDSTIRLLGLAFQIKDDILNVTSDTKTLGKPVYSDQKSNKSTYISLLGLNKAESMLNELITQSKQILSNYNFSFFNDLTDFFLYRTK